MKRSQTSPLFQTTQMALALSIPQTFNTNLCLLSLCKDLQEAQQVHALMIKSSQISNIYSASRLAEFYAVSDNGNLNYAKMVVTSMKEPCTFAWNTLIRGNLKNKNTHEAILVYDRMLCESVEPDCFTFTFVLKACTELHNLGSAQQMHSHIVKHGLESSKYVRNKMIHVYAVSWSISDARKLFDTSTELDIVTWNCMLEGYAKCQDDEFLRELFDAMPYRDVVSWNTVISYYVEVGEFMEAVGVFRRMQVEGERPDNVTLVSVLTAIAHLSALAQGKWVHAYIRRQRIELDENLGSALINMYSKCGCLEGAIEAFDETNRKSVDTWNAILAGMAANGESLKAIKFFLNMEQLKVRPNAITFSSILNACSHGGLVEDGFGYFDKMKNVFGIEPDIVHYGCMVDLLVRARLFDRAEKIIESMPMQPDAVIWKTLLAACKIHKNFELGERAAFQLFELAPDDHAGYVLLSNIYAMADKWDKVQEVRKTMRTTGTRKPLGCSSIELEGFVHEFIVGDITHSRKKEIYEMLDEMVVRLELAGYEPDMKQVMLDIEEEEVKQTSLDNHSEKLAVAFGFISTSPGTTIRVVKNLRICGDCHSSMKLLSALYNRCIIIRDSNRYHHFRNGTCSCMDYW